MAATNLNVKSHQIIGVHKVCPYETEILSMGPRFTHHGKVYQSYRSVCPHTEITHEIHFVSRRYADSIQNVGSPQQDVAMIVWFGAASAVGRPSSSKAVIFGDDVYFLLTYTDILGSGHGKQSDLHRVRNNRMVCYLQLVANPDHKQLILDRVVEAWGRNLG